MYYLSDAKFSKYSEVKKPNYLKPAFTGVKNIISNIPHLEQQVEDFKKLGTAKLLNKVIPKKKPSLKSKIKAGKLYLKYRKFLGDTYGKETGMKMLNDQTNFLKKIVKPQI